jgi:hypothetical protein
MGGCGRNCADRGCGISSLSWTGVASDRFTRIILLCQGRKVVRARGYFQKCGINFLVKFND